MVGVVAGCSGLGCNAMGFGVMGPDVEAGTVGGFVGSGAVLFRSKRNVGDKVVGRH